MTTCRRRSFVLFEVLVASVVATATIIACLSFFIYLWKAVGRLETRVEQEGLLWRRSAHLRWVLSRVQRTRNDDPFMLDDSGRLLFVFDHGVHVRPELANDDLAQLYVDPRLGLVLVTRSHPKRGAIGQEEEMASVIWPNVRRICWKFAICPGDRQGKAGIEQYEQADRWLVAWHQDWKGLPAVIQAEVTELLDDGTEHTRTVTALLSAHFGAIKAR